MIKSVLFASCLTATTAAAQTPPIHATYSGYAHGFNVVDLQAELALAPQTYRLELSYQLVGVLGALIHGDAKTIVSGRFDGMRVEPADLFSAGHFRGDPRVTQLSWRNGTPLTLQLLPPDEGERDVVPVTEQAHTIDTLSAMTGLLHQVAEAGTCDGAARTYDGRRLSEIAAHTAGQETLEPTGRSMFHGVALRCDFQGRQIAGFRRDADQDELRRPQAGSAWFAQVVPGKPPIPVRITFDTPQFGETTVYLTQVQ
jgi:Protein of unknown function (DUF3108)